MDDLFRHEYMCAYTQIVIITLISRITHTQCICKNIFQNTTIHLQVKVITAACECACYLKKIKFNF